MSTPTPAHPAPVPAAPQPPGGHRAAAGMPRRWSQFVAGLAVMMLGAALCVHAQLGVIPWDVLHQGLARRFGLTLSAWVIIVGAVVFLAWIPLRVRPRLGTVVNLVACGVFMDLWMRVLPDLDTMPARVPGLAAGIVLTGAGTALYVGARLGTGPRDGLMTGLCRVTGLSVAVIRTGLEVAVVLTGWALGGNLGIGTLVYAMTVGSIIHVVLPRVTVPGPGPGWLG